MRIPSRPLSTAIALLLIVVVAATLAVSQRQWIAYGLLAATGGVVPPLGPPTTELDTTRWHDDYFTVDLIAPGIWAIGEPRYLQQNVNYLVVGETRALLFDAGAGVRDINTVVTSLTDLPVVFLPSHFHYDHVGNGLQFAQRAVVDLPWLRARARGDELTFTRFEHLGAAEGFELPTWQVDFWWQPGERIDLGGRALEIIHTPGHAAESISLWDAQHQILLSGDYLYPGALYAFVPGANLGDYLRTTENLLARLPAEHVSRGAHRAGPPGPPRLDSQDLADLRTALLEIRDGSRAGAGAWPVEYPVNDEMTLLAEPGPLQDWSTTIPRP